MIIQKNKPNKEKLKLSEVKISTSGLRPESESLMETTITNTPTVYYYGYQLDQNNIKKLVIDNGKFMPMCYLSYIDTQSILDDVGFPADNAKLTIIIPANHPSFANIFMEFKIQKYQIELLRNSTAKKINLWGICNIDKLLISEYMSFDDTSYNTIQKIGQDAGLGFNSNVNNSNDKMIWINSSIKNYEFIQHITSKAWVGESGFIWTFIDLFYNLNYIDVEQSLNQDIQDIKWINTTVYNNTKITKDVDNLVTIPFLTNEPSMRGNNCYFTTDTILNQSTDISIKRGYLRNLYYYDIDGNWSNKAGTYNIYGLDTITSKGTNNNAVYLKGEPGNTEFYSKNSEEFYLGSLDTANAFPDFLWAKMQNQENMYDLQKIPLRIMLPTPNFNIRRFELVKLAFINSNVGVVNQATNTKLNGNWIVTGISFEWNGDSLIQYVNLMKRELTINDI